MAHDTEEVLGNRKESHAAPWRNLWNLVISVSLLLVPGIPLPTAYIRPSHSVGTDIMTEDILVVGMKGEIYTNEELRSKAGIRRGGRVKARVVEDKLIIEPILSIEEIIKKPVVRIGVREAEGISERAQKKAGAYG